MKERKGQIAVFAGFLGILLLLVFPAGMLYCQSKTYEAEKSYLLAELQQQGDHEIIRKILNNLMSRREYFGKETDEKTKELVKEAVESNAYEEAEWYEIEKNRRNKSLWSWGFVVALFLILQVWFFQKYQKRIERENERLCGLLKKGIPILQHGIEEESLEGITQYETE